MIALGILTLALGMNLLPSVPNASSDDWPIWRGPHGNGIAAPNQTPPTTWDESTNVKRAAAVPGRGHSSPTIMGDRIFLTTAELDSETQSFLCYDRSSGEMLWQKVLNTGGLNPKIHKANTHASPSIVAKDGRLFGSFNNHDGIQLICMDFDGGVIWQSVAGPFIQDIPVGYASTPVLYGDSVILFSEYSDGFVAAFKQADGKQLWRQPKQDGTSYASPVIANVGGRDQMLFSGCARVTSYDPSSGEKLWEVKAPWDVACGTIVWDDDMIFVSGGYPETGTLGIKADGSEIVWKNKVKCYEQSLLAYDGYIYAQSDRGMAYCWDAKTGEEKWKERLRGPVSSSPVLAGGNIYLSNERGVTYVIKANPEKFELVAENQLGDGCLTTASIVDSEIYLRVFNEDDGNKLQWLFCLASSDES